MLVYQHHRIRERNLPQICVGSILGSANDYVCKNARKRVEIRRAEMYTSWLKDNTNAYRGSFDIYFKRWFCGVLCVCLQTIKNSLKSLVIWSERFYISRMFSQMKIILPRKIYKRQLLIRQEETIGHLKNKQHFSCFKISCNDFYH